MVCVPCFIIPVLLYLWHKFVQPYVLRFWNPWEKKDKDGNVIKAGPEFPFKCAGGVCPFPAKDKNKPEVQAGADGSGSCTNVAEASPNTEGETKKSL
ncbi:UPF0729 protein AAEL015238 [Wyeomyia smithii]|uniref:UPF0729 protein AAEL015238 n=1 Tax=Wyeomyia smithii TaxID=174621 RepID=UPI002467D983|nr:UPF0729 protein AAEL015238 [Wyeomyia smithii]